MVKIYSNSSILCKVLWKGKLSPHFKVKLGLKQENALSPILFNLPLKKIVIDVGEDWVMVLNENDDNVEVCKWVFILGNSRHKVTDSVEEFIASSRNMSITKRKQNKY